MLRKLSLQVFTTLLAFAFITTVEPVLAVASEGGIDDLSQSSIIKKRVVKKKARKPKRKKTIRKRTTRTVKKSSVKAPKDSAKRSTQSSPKSITKKRTVRTVKRLTERAPSGQPPAGESRFTKGEVIVRYQKNARQRSMDALVRRLNLRHMEGLTFILAGITAHRYEIVSGATVRQTIARLEASSNVVSAQPNYLYELQQAAATQKVPQYALQRLSIDKLPNTNRGKGVVVAIIDTRIDQTHPELASAKFTLRDAIDEEAANSGKTNPHGTSIAGIMAAGLSISGISPQADFVGIRAFAKNADGNTFGNTWTIAKALNIALRQRANIINMSFAGPRDPLVARSLIGARQRNIITVAAAGNAGPNAQTLFPAGYDSVLAVTATDANDAIFVHANQGAHIAISAPGVDIVTLSSNGAFEVSSGTSMAAAHISGIVALLLADSPSMSWKDLHRRLKKSATDLGKPGTDPVFGAGIPNARNLLLGDVGN